MRVLLILEDQELDRFIVKPVIEALFDDIEVKHRVDVLPKRLRGAGEALRADVVREIVHGNPMEDLFLLVVDGDCNREGNDDRAATRQKEHEGKLIACVAREEVEVWFLALYKDELDAPFRDVRAHCDPKERWAEALLRKLGSVGPGHGRKNAMRALKGKWRSLRDTCTELRELQVKIEALVVERSLGA